MWPRTLGVGDERRHHGRHATQRDLGVVRRLGQREDDFGCGTVVVEQDQQRRAAAVGSRVHARRETSPAANLCPGSCASAARSSSLQGNCCGSSQISIGDPRGTAPSRSAKLTFWWRSANDGQLDADHGGHLLLHRTGGDHQLGCLQRLPHALLFDLNRADASGRQRRCPRPRPAAILRRALAAGLQHHRAQAAAR